MTNLRESRERVGPGAWRVGSAGTVLNAWGYVYEGNVGIPGGTSPFYSIPVSGATLPKPADLTVSPYVLPSTFVDGQDVAVLPNGLVWILLAKLSDNVNGCAWNSDQKPATYTTNSGTTPHLYSAYTTVAGLNVVYLQFDTLLTSGDLTATDYSVSGYTVSSAANGFTNGQVILTVSGNITAGATVTLPVSAGMNGHGFSAALSNQSITIIQDRYKYVLCANLVGDQCYIQGDMVGISSKNYSCTDANNVTVSLPLIYPLNADFRVHHHTGVGDGGYAYATVIPFTPGRAFENGGSG